MQCVSVISSLLKVKLSSEKFHFSTASQIHSEWFKCPRWPFKTSYLGCEGQPPASLGHLSPVWEVALHSRTYFILCKHLASLSWLCPVCLGVSEPAGSLPWDTAAGSSLLTEPVSNSWAVCAARRTVEGLCPLLDARVFMIPQVSFLPAACPTSELGDPCFGRPGL